MGETRAYRDWSYEWVCLGFAAAVSALRWAGDDPEVSLSQTCCSLELVVFEKKADTTWAHSVFAL